MKRIRKAMGFVAPVAVVAGASVANAALTFPAIVLTDFDTAVGVILTAIGGLWIARKLIKLGNKS